MALGVQPWMSDSTAELLEDILPFLAQGGDPNDVVYDAVITSDPELGTQLRQSETGERILGLLQIWIADPELIDGYLIPFRQSLVDEAQDPEEVADLQEEIVGLLELRQAAPDEAMETIGVALVQVAMDQLPWIEENYDSWFADQRAQALDRLKAAITGCCTASPSGEGKKSTFAEILNRYLSAFKRVGLK